MIFSALSLWKVCENGKYGQGCTSICGHCFNGSGCHHANGSCLTGCESGYGGDVCKSRKTNYVDLFFSDFQCNLNLCFLIRKKDEILNPSYACLTRDFISQKATSLAHEIVNRRTRVKQSMSEFTLICLWQQLSLQNINAIYIPVYRIKSNYCLRFS